MTSEREDALRAARDAINGLLQANAPADATTISSADDQELSERAIEAATRLHKVRREVDSELELHADRGKGVSRKLGQRILGPYEQHNGWRVIQVDATGKRESCLFETEAKAERYIEMLTVELSREDHTTATALDLYREHLKSKGNKPDSVRQTCWAIGLYFSKAIALSMLSPKRCARLYDEMRVRPTKTGKSPSVDTHRGILAQVRTFLAWCIESGWLRGENPCAEVKGIGKRRPRGKSLGKSGAELRVKEARAWYQHAVYLAHRGDQGAVAVLMAMLLGMRASEITSRRVADLDEDEAPGDLLWIPCSKTTAGRRTLEVPEVLRPYLVACCEGKRADQYIFETDEAKPHRPIGWNDSRSASTSTDRQRHTGGSRELEELTA